MFTFYLRGPENMSLPKKQLCPLAYEGYKISSPDRNLNKFSTFFAEFRGAVIANFLFFSLRHSYLEFVGYLTEFF